MNMIAKIAQTILQMLWISEIFISYSILHYIHFNPFQLLESFSEDLARLETLHAYTEIEHP